jgi:mono/diheme cytochrome c family protein/glucose/arabinose dehydrogenase
MKYNRLKILFGFLLFFHFSCKQQNQAEEPAPPRPEHIDHNPSPEYRTPEESMKTMHLPPGYHLQLVASEPEIQEPVAIVWDGDGRLYVAEMRSYMQDINGTGEKIPICRITRLEDTDGDGKMDKSTIFIDSLVLPRMMLCLDDRLIVNETYSFNLYSYRDTNGDGKADEKILMYHNDAPDEANLEHQKSGLIWNIDNRIYVTYNPVRYRYNNVSGKLDVDSMATGPDGQWGLTQDNFGRMYFSTAGGETPALNFQQNPIYGRVDFENERFGDFDSVWPIIATPDVQGGQERLRADSTLNHFTGSCGQSIFRGDRLPATMLGDYFVCEPVGRLIRRAKVTNVDGEIILKNAYDKREFLASTDMNFRPVNTATGPDGCLYIVDMYHGIIQESAWTRPDSYINPQIRRKGLDKHINRGRIYRLVHDGYTPGPAPRLLEASGPELVAALSHPNGWWRDNAQKLLIIRNDQSQVPALKKLALGEESFWEKMMFWRKTSTPEVRVHALWTLDGLKAIDIETLLSAMKDENPEVRKAALRISESFLKQGNDQVFAALSALKNDPSADVRIQLALSLRYTKKPEARIILNELLTSDKGNMVIVRAATKSLNQGDDSKKELRALVEHMDDDDQRLVFTGASNFSQLCATCHGSDGRGVSSKLAPPLAGAELVKGDKDVLLKILLHGLKGPVNKIKYPDVMPAQNERNDEYIASVLSYIRIGLGNEMGHDGLVYPEDVADMRKQDSARKDSWTMEELSAYQKAHPAKK